MCVCTDLAFLGYLAVGLELCARLSTFQDAVILLGVDVQWLLLQNLSSRKWDALHCGNSPCSWHHLNTSKHNVSLFSKRYMEFAYNICI